MGKYAKIALVLLYALQLAIAFREQLVHFYRAAAHSISRQNVVRVDAGAAPTLLKAYAKESLTAASGALQAVLFIDRETENVEDLFHEDDPKDRIRRPTKISFREFLLSNLFPLIKKRRANPSSAASHGRAIVRVILFPKRLTHGLAA